MRLLAFIIDTIIFVISLKSLQALISLVFGISINSTFITIIGLPLLFTFFEYRYNGQTIGKFLFGLKLTSMNRSIVSPHKLLLRSTFILYIFPTISFLLFLADENFFNNIYQHYLGYIAAIIIYPTLIITFILSLGKQSAHDILYKTIVTRSSSSDINLSSIKIALSIFSLSILIAIIILLILNINIKEINSSIKNSEVGFKIKNISSREVFPIPSTPDLGKDIDNLFDYYNNLHGYKGDKYIELENLQKSEYLKRRLIEDEKYFAPHFTVFVTEKGLLNQFFKDKVVNNLTEYTLKNRYLGASYVEFIYSEIFFGIFAVRISQMLFGYDLILNDGEKVIRVPQVSPVKEGGTFSFTYLGLNAIYNPQSIKSLENMHAI